VPATGQFRRVNAVLWARGMKARSLEQLIAIKEAGLYAVVMEGRQRSAPLA
jgi:hypothetical protein